LFLITGNDANRTNVFATIFQKQSISSNLKDSEGHTKLVPLYKTSIVPKVSDYHDIVSTSVSRTNGDKILLTIDLAGDANRNEKYETVYLWLIYHSSSVVDSSQITDKRDQLYTVILPNFGTGSNFGDKEGRYLAIFNNTNGTYALPLSKILGMPKDKVQVFIDANFIGNPSSSLKLYCFCHDQG
jgi:hypothetical protein